MADSSRISGDTSLLRGWGQVCASPAQVVPVASAAEVANAVQAAANAGRSLIPRGSGFSYGDPALNRDNVVLDMTPMNRVLSWDAGSGIIDLEPGLTVGQLCRHVERDGWWPPVIPGTQQPTVGGCVAANVHGKNNWRAGTIGDHVEEMDVVLADGSSITVSPKRRPELFRAMVGGFGLLGVVTRIRLRMQRSAGSLRVDHFAATRLEDVMSMLDRWSPHADYMVGWIDGFATDKELGRGLLQIAYAGSDGDTRTASKSLVSQASRFAAPALWLGMKPVANLAALKRINAAQYAAGSLHAGNSSLVSRRRFDFFHDFVPNWNRAFKGGIMQFQMFVPRKTAVEVFGTVLQTAQSHGFPPFLAVLKLHRLDDFLLSEGVDGFSLSMDFKVGTRQDELTELLQRLADETVLPADGRFYLAKDSILTAGQAQASFGPEAVREFLDLKAVVDPNAFFQSDLHRRLLN